MDAAVSTVIRSLGLQKLEELKAIEVRASNQDRRVLDVPEEEG